VGHWAWPAISYDIVTQQHGGTITADSEVGEYTEFTINLPRRMFATDRRRAFGHDSQAEIKCSNRARSDSCILHSIRKTSIPNYGLVRNKTLEFASIFLMCIVFSTSRELQCV
jgi:hypothetical protein